jgi:hypothetical protein
MASVPVRVHAAADVLQRSAEHHDAAAVEDGISVYFSPMGGRFRVWGFFLIRILEFSKMKIEVRLSGSNWDW